MNDCNQIYIGQTKQKGLNFHLDIDLSMPQKIIGDLARLRQVIVNLLSNSIKFTKLGEITLFAELIRSEGEQFLIRFVVQDTGIGIEEGIIANLFTPLIRPITAQLVSTGIRG